MIRYDPLLGILHIGLQASFKPFVDLGVISEKQFLWALLDFTILI